MCNKAKPRSAQMVHTRPISYGRLNLTVVHATSINSEKERMELPRGGDIEKPSELSRFSL